MNDVIDDASAAFVPDQQVFDGDQPAPLPKKQVGVGRIRLTKVQLAQFRHGPIC
jgi:hypothetical protein